jgi:hypothetical protein
MTDRRPDDPAIYAKLLADPDPLIPEMAKMDRSIVERWAHNHWTAYGVPFPVPAALYDYYRSIGGSDCVRYMTPVSRTLF